MYCRNSDSQESTTIFAWPKEKHPNLSCAQPGHQWYIYVQRHFGRNWNECSSSTWQANYYLWRKQWNCLSHGSTHSKRYTGPSRTACWIVPGVSWCSVCRLEQLNELTPLSFFFSYTILMGVLINMLDIPSEAYRVTFSSHSNRSLRFFFLLFYFLCCNYLLAPFFSQTRNCSHSIEHRL